MPLEQFVMMNALQHVFKIKFWNYCKHDHNAHACMDVERRNFEEIFTKDGNEASSNSNRKKKEIFLFMKSWALRVSFKGNEVSTGGYKYVYFLFKEIQVSRETCLQSRTISIFSLHSFLAISWLAFLFCLNETRLPNFLLTHIFQFLFRHFSNFFVAMLKMFSRTKNWIFMEMELPTIDRWTGNSDNK